MPTLRLTQHSKGEHKYLIELALEGEGARQTANVECEYNLTPQDQENIRWYLEDYLDAPHDPEPQRAAKIEKRLTDIGVKLFHDVLQANDDARDLWATLRQNLNNTRIELITGVQEAAAIPWELIRDPKTDTPLALRAQAFVRTYSNPAQRPNFVAQMARLPIRILLVICRPGAEDDVPFRSVAMKILKGLHEDARKVFEIDVLRPATFEQLCKTLRQAKADKKPYHVVHFDGHGAFLNLSELFKKWQETSDEELMKLLTNFDRNRFSPQTLYPETPVEGQHGYLCFENPQIAPNMRLVDGSALGKLLVETDVPVLVLNACRSAHAESGIADSLSAENAGRMPAIQSDPHTQVRALGSLAQEVMDTGVAGVVAMRYNVYVVTAAQFVRDLYAALTQGQTLGEAVTFGRKQLKDQPWREIGYKPIPLQDWIVPVIYEAAPIRLFPSREGPGVGKITLTAGETTPTRGVMDSELPKDPDVGFYGRDETLLALDRAFDTQNIVLLHAYAGSGKTTTVAEFARWYALTGGVEVVLFTTFERHLTLARVLAKIERMFGDRLEQDNIHWLALDAEQQRNIALQILSHIPTLWIWDNVEPVAGFPTGTKSMWSTDEQQELVDFLRSARSTRAKFLLTSRRDERGWLGDLPRRIQVPKMPMRERVELAKEIAKRHGHRLTEVEDWRPLLVFTQGNPMTITILVRQAFRDGLITRKQIEDFVAKLRTGEAEFDDEESEGRSKSLGASLQYGFGHAFSEDERKKLALLHFFQGFVETQVLVWMGDSKNPGGIPEIRNMTHEAWIDLLDRTAEVGLLTAYGGDYHIHPALPWYFKSLFEETHPQPLSLDKERGAEEGTHPRPLSLASAKERGEEESAPPLFSAGKERGSGGELATRAFVEAMGALGDYYHNQYGDGNCEVIHALSAEEANLLHARRLARQHGWWGTVTSTMQGLHQLYAHTGRRAEWAQLVREIVPDFVDPETDGPLPGQETDWGLVTEYRVRLAYEAREWAEAERLQRVCVAWDRQWAAEALQTLAAQTPGVSDSHQRNQIRTLAASLNELGEIQREMGQPECVNAYQEALKLSEQIGEQAGAASCALNLGRAYQELPNLRDLAQAEAWYQRSLELRAEGDRLGQAKCLTQLGSVAYERFKEARAADRPKAEMLRHLNDAVSYYQNALGLLPPNAVNDLAVVHNALGVIYDDASDLDRAMFHWCEAICYMEYMEAADNFYMAAGTRYNVALALARAERLDYALDYAQAALRNYATYGDRAAAEMQKTQRLIARIEQALK